MRPRGARVSTIDLVRTRERLLWKAGVQFVTGVDEAGVGPLAGPVVAAAVVLPAGFDSRGVNDSKQMTENARAAAAAIIRDQAVSYCVAEASEQEIDSFNIYHATMLAMRRAVAGLSVVAGHALVDGRTIPDLPIPQTRVVGGDAIEPTIAAASILAKVHRDGLMAKLHLVYPMYGFDLHKGYPTPDHQTALKTWGPSPVHRMSYPAVLEWSGLFSDGYREMKAALDEVETEESLESWRRQIRKMADKLTETERKRLRSMAQRRFTKQAFKNS